LEQQANGTSLRLRKKRTFTTARSPSSFFIADEKEKLVSGPQLPMHASCRVSPFRLARTTSLLEPCADPMLEDKMKRGEGDAYALAVFLKVGPAAVPETRAPTPSPKRLPQLAKHAPHCRCHTAHALATGLALKTEHQQALDASRRAVCQCVAAQGDGGSLLVLGNNVPCDQLYLLVGQRRCRADKRTHAQSLVLVVDAFQAQSLVNITVIRRPISCTVPRP
jgi:hypothetical protein